MVILQNTSNYVPKDHTAMEDTERAYQVCYYDTDITLQEVRHMSRLSRVWPLRRPCGGTQCVVFIGPIFHNTIETCLKRVAHGGYE